MRGECERLIDEQSLTLDLCLWIQTRLRLDSLFTICFNNQQLMAFKSHLCLSATLLELHVH